jgi:putative SOS response-associated peptidase YedK
LSAANPAKPDHIHARAETIDVKPTFRAAFRERRGVLLVDSFNEGEELTPSKTLQYVVTPESGGLLAIAVLWEAWHHDGGGELLTFVMATVPPNNLLGEKFDRMPAVLAPDDIPAWLGEIEATPDELKAMLVTTEGRWDLSPEKKTPPPRKPTPQGELF